MKEFCNIFIITFLFNLTVSCQIYKGPTDLVSVPEKKDSSALLFNKPIPDHPRLLFTKEQEATIKNLKSSDPFLSNLSDLLKNEADKLLNSSLISYPTGVSDILAITREHLYRMITLSLAYRMFGDPRYAAKAEENLINVCNYPDWDPNHYLDVAEMTTAVAIGYDWLYSYLSEDTKTFIRKSIKEKALLLAEKEYRAGGTNWAKRENNWNVVCNTGMIMGALAVAENEPAIAEEIITEGVKCVPICLKYFAPDGVCYEGPGYWYYTNVNLAMLINCLSDNLGNDYGLSALSGVSRTAAYYVSSVSPSGRIFNFADTGSDSPNLGPAYFFFSKKFGLPQVAEFYRSLIAQVILSPGRNPRWHFFLNIPWYDSAKVPASAETPKLQIFDNPFNPIMVFTGSKSASNPIYLIAKGGAGDLAHQHLDIGSFIIESNGVRWLDDLGTVAADYSLTGFWDYTPYTGQRWKYFRYNNFSHNTLSIDSTLQNSAGRGIILRYNKVDNKPFSIVDMTNVYDKLATKVQRGFRLLSDQVVLVRDEVALAAGAKKIQWRAVTNADMTINGNTATLQKSGKTFYLRILAPANATFTKEVAKTNSSKEAAVTGYYLLKTTVAPEDGTNQTIQIVMGSDLKALNDTNLTGSIQPLSNWQ